MQSASWYSTSPGKVRRQFTAFLAAEWQGVLNQKWNYEETPFLCPCGPDKDLKRPQGQGDPGKDQLPPRPLRERYTFSTGGGCVGGGQGQGGPHHAPLRGGEGSLDAKLSRHLAVRENPTCTDFEENKEVPATVPLDF